MLIVFLGLGSEYALGGMVREARRRGHDVVELDMYDQQWRATASNLPSECFTLVTTHHPYLDSTLHKRLFGQTADIDALPAFIGQHRPRRTYYVPHDLSLPLHDAELHALYLFDGLLMPDDRYWFLAGILPVHVVGWLKADPLVELPFTPVTFLPSDVSFYARQEPALFKERFGDILLLSPRVKLPVFPGCERLEELVTGFGCEVIQPQTDSSSLLAATGSVVSNGVSSILSEALLWSCKTYCVLDGRPDHSEQSTILATLPKVRTCLPGRTAQALAEDGERCEVRACPPGKPSFRYDLVFEILEAA